MFEHELIAAQADFDLSGSESPSLGNRVKRLHCVFTVGKSQPHWLLNMELEAISAFLERMRSFGFLDGLPDSYPGLTVTDLLPTADSLRLGPPAQSVIREKLIPKKAKKKKRRKKPRKRPKLIFSSFESNRRRH